MKKASHNPNTCKTKFEIDVENKVPLENKTESNTSFNKQFIVKPMQSKVGSNFGVGYNQNYSDTSETIDTSSSLSSCINNHLAMKETIPNVNQAKFELIFKLVSEGHITPDKFNTETESLLGIACSTGHFNLVRLLLQKGADVNHLGENGEHTPLMEAVNNNSLKIATILINNKANVNAKSKSGYTALHIACASGSLPCTKLLIDSGADPTICSALLRTPVMEAAFCGHAEIIAFLLDKCPKTINSTECLATTACNNNNNNDNKDNSNNENNANNNNVDNNNNANNGTAPNATNVAQTGCSNDNFFKMCQINFRESPLLIASHRGHADAVRIILERMSFMTNPEEDIMSSILEATIDCHVKVVELLLKFASKNFDIGEALNSPLTLAASGGHLGLVKLFIDYGASPNDFNAEGFTPLMEACREGHLDVIKYFLSSEVGAKINTLTKEHGETALTISCCSGNLEVVKYLVEVGKASVELGHSPPLLEAASENHADIVEYLIKKGAPVNAKGTVSRDALYQACEAGNIDVVKVLITYKADIESLSDDNKTPLMRAVESGHIDIVEYLISKGAKVNPVIAQCEWTPLIIACLSGNVIMARYLVACGADPKICTSDSSSLLIEATRAGHLNIVAFLLNPSINTPNIPSDCNNHQQQIASNIVNSSGGLNKPSTVYWPSEMSETDRLKSLIPPRILDLYMKTNKITDKNVACNSMASAFQAYSKKLFDNASTCPNNNNSTSTSTSTSATVTVVTEESLNSLTTTASSNNNNNGINSNTLKKPTRMCEYHNLIESMCSVDWNNLPNELLALGNCSYEYNNIINEEHCVVDNSIEMDSNNCYSSRNISLLNLLEHLSLRGSKLVSPGIAQVDECFSMPTNPQNIPSNDNGDYYTDCCCLTSYANKYLQMNDIGSPPPISEECIGRVVQKINDHFKNVTSPLIDVNHCDESTHDSSLLISANLGYIDIVSYLVRNNANVNISDSKGYTPLMMACAAGHFQVARYLATLKQIDINKTSNRTHETALSLAAAVGRYEFVELLLNNGANTEISNGNEYTPLCLAANNGHLDIVQLLLSRNANVNGRNNFTPLMLAVMNGHEKVCEMLISYGADVNVVAEKNGGSALSLAIFSNKANLADLLLKHGAVPDCKSKSGHTPFMDAVASNNVAIARILLDYNCDSTATSSVASRETAMLTSAEKGHIEFLELLLQRKFPLDCRNKKGQTPSWLSATNGFLNCLIMLFENKANIELPDYSGVSPLFSAIKNCHIEVVEWLVSKVDHFPALSVCQKYISKYKPALKSKYVHTFEILDKAIHRKSQIAEMNAFRLLQEEEQMKNKKKKKRKSKKPIKSIKEPEVVASVATKTNTKSTKQQVLTSTEIEGKNQTQFSQNTQKSILVSNINDMDSIKSNTCDESADDSSMKSSDSDGWMHPQQQQQQQIPHQSFSQISTSYQQSPQTQSQSSNVTPSKKLAKPVRVNHDLSESITDATFVTRTSVSKTIGRNGSTISAIKAKTSTYIDIDTNTEFDGGRICKTTVIGKKEGVEEAKRLLKLVENNAALALEELAPFLGEYAQYNFNAPANVPTNISMGSASVTPKITFQDSVSNINSQKKPTPISVSTTRSPSSYKQPFQDMSCPVEPSNNSSSVPVTTVNFVIGSNNINGPIDKNKRIKSSGNAKEMFASTSSSVANSSPVYANKKTQKSQSPVKTTVNVSKDNHTCHRKHHNSEISPTSTIHGVSTIKLPKPNENHGKVENPVLDDLSWFPLLKSSEYLLRRKQKKVDSSWHSYSGMLDAIKKNSFPKSLNETTFFGCPNNEMAFDTLRSNRHNLKLAPGRGRYSAPVSRLFDNKYAGSCIILQKAHDKYPSFVSTLDHEAFLRVNDSIMKEISPISSSDIHESHNFQKVQADNPHFSNSSPNQIPEPDPNSLRNHDAPNTNGSTMSQKCQVSSLLSNVSNVLTETFDYNPPITNNQSQPYAPSAIGGIPSAFVAHSAIRYNINPLLPTPLNNNLNLGDNENFKYKSSSVPVSPMHQPQTMPPYRMPSYTAMMTPPNPQYMQRFNNIRPVNFSNVRSNFPPHFHYVNDTNTDTVGIINPMNNCPPHVRTPIYSFLERYGIIDLFDYIRGSIHFAEELAMLTDSQLLDINVPVRYIETLHMALGDFFVESAPANLDNSNNSNYPRNSHGYNFHHSDYNP